MSHDDVVLVRDTLTERAERVAAPSAGLAGRARRRARARRRRQGYGIAVVAVGIALASQSVLPGGQVRKADPAVGPVTVVDLHTPDGAVAAFEPSTLPAGRGPRRAWLLGNVLHTTDGGGTSLPDGVWSAVEGPCAGQVLASGGITSAPLLWTVSTATGEASAPVRAGPPAVRADGLVAYLDQDQPGTLVTSDRFDCSATAKVGVPPPARDAQPVGFLGTEQVVVNVPGTAARVLHLDGTWSRLPGLATATATDGRDSVASRRPHGGCVQVQRAGVPLWMGCGLGPSSSLVAFSPDSHHVLLRHAGVSNPSGVDYALVATETGAVERLFLATDHGSGHAGLVQAVFEDDATLLFAAYQGATSILVRCDFTGQCERAVPDGGVPDAAWPRAPFGWVGIP